jgi:8-oxo-dGTP pyrophosphatase MutT (NUDIX family)
VSEGDGPAAGGTAGGPEGGADGGSEGGAGAAGGGRRRRRRGGRRRGGRGRRTTAAQSTREGGTGGSTEHGTGDDADVSRTGGAKNGEAATDTATAGAAATDTAATEAAATDTAATEAAATDTDRPKSGRRRRSRGSRGRSRRRSAAKAAGPAGDGTAGGDGAGKQPASGGAKATGAKTTGAKARRTKPAEASSTGATKRGTTTGKGKSPARRGARGGRRRMEQVDEVSAGGVVVQGTGASARAVLIGKIDRRGRLVWSLPKGHVEQGETFEQTAAREVEEETGILGDVVAVLGTVDYWFVADGRRIHKTVHHFLLRAVGGELSDEDVEVEEVEWVPIGELTDRLAYPDERRLVERIPEMLATPA